jgi:hypothetical protein
VGIRSSKGIHSTPVDPLTGENPLARGEGGRAAGPAAGGERSVVPCPAAPPHLSGVG